MVRSDFELDECGQASENEEPDQADAGGCCLVWVVFVHAANKQQGGDGGQDPE